VPCCEYNNVNYDSKINGSISQPYSISGRKEGKGRGWARGLNLSSESQCQNYSSWSMAENYKVDMQKAQNTLIEQSKMCV